MGYSPLMATGATYEGDTMTARLDVQVELGCLFGTVHASLVGDDLVGAHVEIDGNVISDTNLLPFTGDPGDALFRTAVGAYKRACSEIGVEAYGRSIHDIAVGSGWVVA